jgi:hypothetical protein
MLLVGPGVTLLGAKTMACAGAALLYHTRRVWTLIALTTMLGSLAVGPWLAFLRSIS